MSCSKEQIKQVMIRQKQIDNELKKQGYFIPNESGIYILTRQEDFAYIGQARNLKQRVISHIMGYEQPIDISLKKRKLFSKDNLGGWNIRIIKCDVSELDDMEREKIKSYQDAGFTLYNVTNGGQNSGKTDINERKPSKTYKDGVEYGKTKKMAEIKEFFDKYLEVSIKGTPNKTKERKLQEFKEIMKNGN